MFNAHTVHVHSPKAGVGCSTVAAALAVIAGETGAVVHVADLSPAGDLAAVIGIPIPDTGRIANFSATLELVRLDPADTVEVGDGWVAHIVDWGTRPVPADVPGHRVGVMANCYLAAAAYTRRPTRIDHGGRVHLVAVIDPNRSLTVRDIEHATSATALATWTRSAEIARATDAGLLTNLDTDRSKDLRHAAPIVPTETRP